jgi:hypothetical protein
MPDTRVTLYVETPDGVIIQRLPNALPLREDTTVGRAAEDAAQMAAAIWGMPDFVYRPTIRQAGTGQRELGDAVILVGNLGIVVQVKSREKPTDDLDRERAWVNKSVAKALSQADGTIRKLREYSTVLTNVRGRTFRPGTTTVKWHSVVVIDHPEIPEMAPKIHARNPAVLLTRADWEFLFSQLRSTHAVATYVSRVAGEETTLGEEAVRYYQLAHADQVAESDPLDERLDNWAGVRRTSSPALPLYPPEEANEPALRLIRLIFEDVATAGSPNLIEEENRLQALAELDRLPVVDRADIGAFLLESMSKATRVDPTMTEWRFRSMVSTPREHSPVHLGFGVCSQGSSTHRDAFGAWAQLRHHELHELLGQDFLTVAVLLTPSTSDSRPWDTSMVAIQGDLQLDDEAVSQLRSVWNNDALMKRW